MLRLPSSPRPLLAGALALAFITSSALAGCSSDANDAKGSTTTPGSTTAAPIDDARLDTVWTADEVEGPITGGTYGIPYLAMPEGWAEEYDYTEEEFFLSGDAVSYGATSKLTTDGMWDVRGTSATQPYKTRIVVRRPADDAKFNGTLVVEWLNVTAGRDSDPDFGYLGRDLMAEGFAYIGVSAQRTGVEPGGLGIDIPGVPEEALAPLKDWDPERYASLSHPGDQYSYDMFSQAARTVLEPGDDAPLHGLEVQHVIAAGESQSASRLVSYVNAVQPLTGMFDGFLIHSRGAGATALDDAAGQTPPDGTHIRDDIDVPVFQFETETDVEGLKFVAARQDDHGHLRTWEVAGAAHVDRSALDYGVAAGRRWTDVNVDLSTACGQVNEGPMTEVLQKAFHDLHRWVIDGTAPAASPQLQTDDADVIVRDDAGIALGGIRTPAVDVPIAVHTGLNPSDDIICQLFGSTTPFTQAELDARYADHDTYVEAVRASASKAVEEGFFLQTTADQLIEDADNSTYPELP